jgi:hypothetical protein
MFNVDRSLITTVTEVTDKRMNDRIKCFIASLDVKEIAGEFMNDIQNAIDSHVFGRDDGYVVFKPAGIAVFGSTQSVVHMSQPAGTARHPDRTTFLRMLYASTVNERIVDIVERHLYYEEALCDEQRERFRKEMVSRLDIYSRDQQRRLDASPFMAAVRTIQRMPFPTIESRYLLQGPLPGTGKWELSLKYDALRDVQQFHQRMFGMFNLRFHLTKAQYDELQALGMTLYAIGLQLSDCNGDHHPEDYNEDGLLDIRRQRRNASKLNIKKKKK